MTSIRPFIIASALITLTATMGCAKQGETPATPAGQSAQAVDPGAPEIGAAAIDSSVLQADGAPVQLASAWQDGPAVIVFYRGHWCGYCRKQLEALEAERDQVEALGASLVAISAAAEDPAEMREKTGVGFPLYADPDRAAIESWGVLDAENEIARPAIFVVDRDGAIVYAYVGKDKSDRPVFAEVLARLRALQQG